MRIRTPIATLAPAMLALLATLCGGCGGSTRSVSLNAWQQSVQGYVVDHGNGDMNALRDVDVLPGQPGFRVFSADRPEDATDIAGSLVGVHLAQGRAWYVYVVGEVKKEEVTSLRIAAVTYANPKFEWRVSEADKTATEAYRASRRQAWSEGSHDTAGMPRGALGFPNPTDVFEMRADGDVITVRETTSNAQWTLSLAANEAQRK